MKTKTILIAFILGTTLFANAQEAARKGWDGSVKGSKMTKADSGLQSNEVQSPLYKGNAIKPQLPVNNEQGKTVTGSEASSISNKQENDGDPKPESANADINRSRCNIKQQ